MTPTAAKTPTNSSSNSKSSSTTHSTPTPAHPVAPKPTGLSTSSGSNHTTTNPNNGNRNPNPGSNPGNYAGRQGTGNSSSTRTGGVKMNTPGFTHVSNTGTYVNADRGRGSGPESAVDHGRGRHIPDSQFHSHFGGEHEFHVSRQMTLGGYRRFQFGGVVFGIAQPWPAAWRETDVVYVDYAAGGYFLCNRMQPGIRIPLNVDDCSACAQTASTSDCTQCDASANSDPGADPGTTLTRGQTIAEVVAILGAPMGAIDLGVKQIYLYQNMKVTFLYGRMSDVI